MATAQAAPPEEPTTTTVVTEQRRQSEGRILKILPWIVTPSLVVLIIVVWQVLVTALKVNPFVFPPPAAVGEAFVTLVLDGSTWGEAAVTLTEILVGFVIAVLMGVIVGVAFGKLPWLEVSIRPLIVVAQVAPKVAFIPLFVIWFGFGITSKVLLAALLAFFPVMLNVLLGVRSVERGQREVMRSLNASRAQMFTQLEMRSLQPYLFAGMEVGIVLATTGAIVGEYLGGSVGLGAMVVRAMNSLDAARTFALILLLSLIGLALYLIVNEAKRFFIPWHESVYGLREGM
ncbi:ABC transporter permease [Microbacterium lushaniae]|uniref:ABC transporter permease n=1 Tax=Microbacterium lushaniae TaxID=2614639 RepID=A0A5J5JJ43_9MICO|nr:ABC transporter permease [Microbacterium lushaniae]KAA9149684.1 ABC transporter permease [Microbacterium lushaniae]KAA9153023.1 ABC transporter permease [Microbacterium lushaniae]QEW04394.1 ABC transporter permease [Microbacterium lushaniae]